MLLLLKDRLPSRQEAIEIFGIVSFPVFVWATIQILREMPSWLLRLTLPDLVAVVAYVEAFAFIESLVVFVGVVSALMLLPATWLVDRRVLVASVVTLVLSAVGVTAHYTDQTLRQWGWQGIAVVIGLMLLATAFLLYLGLRSDRWPKLMNEAVDRIVLLSYLYLTLGILGLVIVIVRNL